MVLQRIFSTLRIKHLKPNRSLCPLSPLQASTDVASTIAVATDSALQAVQWLLDSTHGTSQVTCSSVVNLALRMVTDLQLTARALQMLH